MLFTMLASNKLYIDSKHHTFLNQNKGISPYNFKQFLQSFQSKFYNVIFLQNPSTNSLRPLIFLAFYYQELFA